MMKYMIFIVTEKFTFLIAQNEWGQKDRKNKTSLKKRNVTNNE